MTIGAYGYDPTTGPNPDFLVRSISRHKQFQNLYLLLVVPGTLLVFERCLGITLFLCLCVLLAQLPLN